MHITKPKVFPVKKIMKKFVKQLTLFVAILLGGWAPLVAQNTYGTIQVTMGPATTAHYPIGIGVVAGAMQVKNTTPYPVTLQKVVLTADNLSRKAKSIYFYTEDVWLNTIDLGPGRLTQWGEKDSLNLTIQAGDSMWLWGAAELKNDTSLIGDTLKMRVVSVQATDSSGNPVYVATDRNRDGIIDLSEQKTDSSMVIITPKGTLTTEFTGVKDTTIIGGQNIVLGHLTMRAQYEGMYPTGFVLKLWRKGQLVTHPEKYIADVVIGGNDVIHIEGDSILNYGPALVVYDSTSVDVSIQSQPIGLNQPGLPLDSFVVTIRALGAQRLYSWDTLTAIPSFGQSGLVTITTADILPSFIAHNAADTVVTTLNARTNVTVGIVHIAINTPFAATPIVIDSISVSTSGIWYMGPLRVLDTAHHEYPSQVRGFFDYTYARVNTTLTNNQTIDLILQGDVMHYGDECFRPVIGNIWYTVAGQHFMWGSPVAWLLGGDSICGTTLVDTLTAQTSGISDWTTLGGANVLAGLLQLQSKRPFTVQSLEVYIERKGQPYDSATTYISEITLRDSANAVIGVGYVYNGSNVVVINNLSLVINGTKNYTFRAQTYAFGSGSWRPTKPIDSLTFRVVILDVQNAATHAKVLSQGVSRLLSITNVIPDVDFMTTGVPGTLRVGQNQEIGRFATYFETGLNTNPDGSSIHILLDSVAVRVIGSGVTNLTFEKVGTGVLRQTNTRNGLFIGLNMDTVVGNATQATSVFIVRGDVSDSLRNTAGCIKLQLIQMGYRAETAARILNTVKESPELCNDITGTPKSIGHTPLRAYPNPSSNRITVEGMDQEKPADIVDVLGRTIRQDYPGTSMDISDLPAGVYCIRQGIQAVKFVKK